MKKLSAYTGWRGIVCLEDGEYTSRILEAFTYRQAEAIHKICENLWPIMAGRNQSPEETAKGQWFFKAHPFMGGYKGK